MNMRSTNVGAVTKTLILGQAQPNARRQQQYQKKAAATPLATTHQAEIEALPCKHAASSTTKTFI